MAYSAFPRIYSRRPLTAGTWDLTGRQRLADDLQVRFADRPRSDRDERATVTEVCTLAFHSHVQVTVQC